MACIQFQAMEYYVGSTKELKMNEIHPWFKVVSGPSLKCIMQQYGSLKTVNFTLEQHAASSRIPKRARGIRRTVQSKSKFTLHVQVLAVFVINTKRYTTGLCVLVSKLSSEYQSSTAVILYNKKSRSGRMSFIQQKGAVKTRRDLK